MFLVAEVALFLAIPLLAYLGFRTLLDTRTGTFIEDPGPESPGWVALVDPTPVVGVVEMDDSEITGVAVVASIGQTARGGAVVLIPAELETGPGQVLRSMSPAEAIDAVAGALQLRIPTVEIVDAQRWSVLLGDTSYALDNPDPVPGASGEILFEVGQVEVSGPATSAFLGRTVDGADSLAALVRRELFWTELLKNPPAESADQLSRTIRSLSEGPHEVVVLPLERGSDGVPVASPERTELLIRRLVAFPAGDSAGDRFRVQIEDRTGEADLDSAARALGRLGVEVVAISNGAVFDDSPTAFMVEAGSEEAEELMATFPGVPVNPSATQLPSDPIVLQLGPDHLAVLSRWESN
ncbi:MAG: hypothetical protein ACN4GZ_17100 [Acidimicrobiales bacterium]